MKPLPKKTAQQKENTDKLHGNPENGFNFTILLCMYVHICYWMYVCMYVSLCMYVYGRQRCGGKNTSVYVCTYVWIYIRMYVYMYCIYKILIICMYVVCMWLRFWLYVLTMVILLFRKRSRSRLAEEHETHGWTQVRTYIHTPNTHIHTYIHL